GEFSPARKDYEDALQAVEKLPSLTATPDPADRLRLAVASYEMAIFLRENGHDEEAGPYFEKAVSLTEPLFERFDELLLLTQSLSHRGNIRGLSIVEVG